MEYSGAGGKLIHETNQKQKISWHCPFKKSELKEPIQWLNTKIETLNGLTEPPSLPLFPLPFTLSPLCLSPHLPPLFPLSSLCHSPLSLLPFPSLPSAFPLSPLCLPISPLCLHLCPSPRPIPIIPLSPFCLSPLSPLPFPFLPLPFPSLPSAFPSALPLSPSVSHLFISSRDSKNIRDDNAFNIANILFFSVQWLLLLPLIR